MKPLLTAAVLSLASASALHADDWDKLEGSWHAASMDLAGTPFGADLLKDCVLTITRGKYDLIIAKQKDAGEVSLGGKKELPEMDIKGKEGPNKGKTYLCIYKLDGDTLKVCYSLDGKTRPAEFKATKENGFFLAEYKKAKK